MPKNTAWIIADIDGQPNAPVEVQFDTEVFDGDPNAFGWVSPVDPAIAIGCIGSTIVYGCQLFPTRDAALQARIRELEKEAAAKLAELASLRALLSPPIIHPPDDNLAVKQVAFLLTILLIIAIICILAS